MHLDKDLVAASATTLVLGILHDADSYGYAILKRVTELSGGEIEWTDGMLYPLLHRLERLGHVQSYWQTSEQGRRRKHYSLTPEGAAVLQERRTQWQTVDRALNRLWTVPGIA
ncbi:MAG TPA: PadR family transcriptional regulator [Aeromicrobium sp.]|nr:PadR family transcriptional regulator [Aeromicrobium sp.]